MLEAYHHQMAKMCLLCSFYKNLALGVLSECYSSDKRKTTLLVVHQMINYGRTTPLQLAVHAGNIQFVTHPACHNAITAIWHGRLQVDNSFVKVRPVIYPDPPRGL